MSKCRDYGPDCSNKHVIALHEVYASSKSPILREADERENACTAPQVEDGTQSESESKTVL